LNVRFITKNNILVIFMRNQQLDRTDYLSIYQINLDMLVLSFKEIKYNFLNLRIYIFDISFYK